MPQLKFFPTSGITETSRAASWPTVADMTLLGRWYIGGPAVYCIYCAKSSSSSNVYGYSWINVGMIHWMRSGCKEPISRRGCVVSLMWFRFSRYLWISVSKLTDKTIYVTSRSGILISWWVYRLYSYNSNYYYWGICWLELEVDVELPVNFRR